MPTIKDKTTGKVVAELPYDIAGKQSAENIADTNPNYEVVDAGSRSESYQLGGQIPGQPGFGQRPSPIPNPLGASPIPNPLGASPIPNPLEGSVVVEPQPVPLTWKKGGKVGVTDDPSGDDIYTGDENKLGEWITKEHPDYYSTKTSKAKKEVDKAQERVDKGKESYTMMSTMIKRRKARNKARRKYKKAKRQEKRA